MLDQCLSYGCAILAVGIVNASRPDITGRDYCHSIEIVVAGYIGARHHLPATTIPMFDESTYYLIRSIPTSDCPYVIGGDGGYTKKIVIESEIDRGHDLPVASVPVLSKRLGTADRACVPDSPYVTGRDRCYAEKIIWRLGYAGTGYRLETCAIPMFCQGFPLSALTKIISYSPAIACREKRDTVERSQAAWRGTRHDLPARQGSLYCSRAGQQDDQKGDDEWWKQEQFQAFHAIPHVSCG